MNNGITLHYGTCQEVIEILDLNQCTEGELRSALINAFKKIDWLEKEVQQLKLEKDGL